MYQSSLLKIGWNHTSGSQVEYNQITLKIISRKPQYLIQIFHKLNPNPNSSGIKYTKVCIIAVIFREVKTINIF